MSQATEYPLSKMALAFAGALQAVFVARGAPVSLPLAYIWVNAAAVTFCEPLWHWLQSKGKVFQSCSCAIVFVLANAIVYVISGPTVTLGDATTNLIEGSNRRINILVPAKFNSRVADATPQLLNFHKEGASCLPGGFDPGGICVGFPIDVVWNGKSLCTKAASGNETVVPFAIVGRDSDLKLLMLTCSDLYDLNSLKTEIPPGKYVFDLHIDAPGMETTRRRYRFSWTGMERNFAIQSDP